MNQSTNDIEQLEIAAAEQSAPQILSTRAKKPPATTTAPQMSFAFDSSSGQTETEFQPDPDVQVAQSADYVNEANNTQRTLAISLLNTEGRKALDRVEPSKALQVQKAVICVAHHKTKAYTQARRGDPQAAKSFGWTLNNPALTDAIGMLSHHFMENHHISMLPDAGLQT